MSSTLTSTPLMHTEGEWGGGGGGGGGEGGGRDLPSPPTLNKQIF